MRRFSRTLPDVPADISGWKRMASFLWKDLQEKLCYTVLLVLEPERFCKHPLGDTHHAASRCEKA